MIAFTQAKSVVSFISPFPGFSVERCPENDPSRKDPMGSLLSLRCGAQDRRRRLRRRLQPDLPGDVSCLTYLPHCYSFSPTTCLKPIRKHQQQEFVHS